MIQRAILEVQFGHVCLRIIPIPNKQAFHGAFKWDILKPKTARFSKVLRFPVAEFKVVTTLQSATGNPE